MANRLDVRDLKARIRNWDAVLTDLAPELQPALVRKGRHGPCPVHDSPDGFRLFKDGSGGGVCSTCGTFPDGFAVLQWIRQWTFRQSLEAVAGWLGDAPWPVIICRTPLAVSDPTANRRREHLAACWRQAVPLTAVAAEPARRYLANRGLALAPYPTVLRGHPALPYYQDGQLVGGYPTLLALVADADGRPVTLHRTYLTPTGAKAPVPAVKKLMGYASDRRLSGGAIRLFPANDTLHLAEGIETALAVYRATGEPVWSTVSAGLLARVALPATVLRVVVWGDLDRSGAGQQAAQALAQRLRQEGRQATVHLPPGPIPAAQKSLDWLDVWVHGRAAAWPGLATAA